MSDSNPLSSLPNGVDISSVANSMFVGVLLSPVLWGITVSQTWSYYNSNKDGWLLQTFVGVLFVLDTAATCLTSEMAHVYLIQNFGSLEALSTLPTSSIVEVAVNVFIVFLVELFFARRVYLLNRRQIFMPVLIIVFAAAGLVSGILIVVDISQSPVVLSLATPRMKVQVALTNTFEAISDLLATFALSYEFYKNKGGVKSTNTLLEKLLGFTVARGGLVTVAQFLTLALYVAQPTKLNWMPVHFMLGKLCHITMVVILNSRDSMRPKGSIINDSMFTDSALGGRQLVNSGTQFQLRTLDSSENNQRPEGKPGLASIHVHQEQITTYDEPKHQV